MQVNSDSIHGILNSIIAAAEEIAAAGGYADPRQNSTLRASANEDIIKTKFNTLAQDLQSILASDSSLEQAFKSIPEFSNVITESLQDLKAISEHFNKKKLGPHLRRDSTDISFSDCSKEHIVRQVSNGFQFDNALLSCVDHLRKMIMGIAELQHEYWAAKEDLRWLFGKIDSKFLCHLSRHHVNRLQTIKAKVGENFSANSIIDQSLSRGQKIITRVTDLEKHSGKYCSICKEYVPVKNMQSWKDHIMAELQAYICVSPDGEDGAECSMEFPTAQAWYEHELKYHSDLYVCNQAKCSHPATTRSGLKKHFIDYHGFTTNVSLEGNLRKSRQYDEVISRSKNCPFCQKTLSLKVDGEFEMFNSHVAEHLEQNALRAVLQLSYRDWNDDGERPVEISSSKTTPLHSARNSGSKFKTPNEQISGSSPNLPLAGHGHKYKHSGRGNIVHGILDMFMNDKGLLDKGKEYIPQSVQGAVYKALIAGGALGQPAMAYADAARAGLNAQFVGLEGATFDRKTGQPRIRDGEHLKPARRLPKAILEPVRKTLAKGFDGSMSPVLIPTGSLAHHFTAVTPSDVETQDRMFDRPISPIPDHDPVEAPYHDVENEERPPPYQVDSPIPGTAETISDNAQSISDTPCQPEVEQPDYVINDGRTISDSTISSGSVDTSGVNEIDMPFHKLPRTPAPTVGDIEPLDIQEYGSDRCSVNAQASAPSSSKSVHSENGLRPPTAGCSRRQKRLEKKLRLERNRNSPLKELEVANRERPPPRNRSPTTHGRKPSHKTQVGVGGI